MKNMKFARTLLTLALVLVVLGSVIGGTIAWFTDEVTSTNNIIKSGTLDMDVQVMGDENAWISLEKNPNTAVFDYDLWEPGYTQYEYVRIVNNGSLAFEYILNVVPGTDEVKGPNGESLADVIDVYVGTEEPTDRALTGMDKLGTIADLLDPAADANMVAGILLPAEGKGATDVVAPSAPVYGEIRMYIALHMQEEAGNEYQNLSLGTVGFTAEAKQYTYEEDSFDHTYDEYSQWHSETTNDPVINVELPEAGMNPIDDLTVTLSNKLGTLGGVPTSMLVDGTTDKMELDCGLTFIATQTPEDIVGKPYENWNADFTVTVNKDITKADCENGIVPLVLAGQYDFYDANWIPIPVTADDEFFVTANKPVRLLTMAGAPWTYENILLYVTEFDCGVKADPSWATPGTKVFVQLRVYEVDENNAETGNSYVVRNYTHTY